VKRSLNPLRPVKPRSYRFSFLTQVNTSTYPEWYCTIRSITRIMLLLLLLVLPLLLLLLLLLLQYFRNPSPFRPVFTVIIHVGQVGNTWKIMLNLTRKKDLRIMFTLKSMIRV